MQQVQDFLKYLQGHARFCGRRTVVASLTATLVLGDKRRHLTAFSSKRQLPAAAQTATSEHAPLCRPRSTHAASSHLRLGQPSVPPYLAPSYAFSRDKAAPYDAAITRDASAR